MTTKWWFIRILFYFRGTVIENIWPQILLGAVLVSVLKVLNAVWGYRYVDIDSLSLTHTHLRVCVCVYAFV